MYTQKEFLKETGTTWRSILIGMALIPPNTYWIMASVGQGYPETVSLYFNVIFCITLLIVLNFIIVKVSPKSALRQGELITVYTMLCLATSVAGHDMLRVLLSMIPHAFWFASPENDWEELFHRYVKDWIAIKDRNFLIDYYRGETTFYTLERIKGWLIPSLAWSAFLFALVSVMLFINVIVRKRWTESEKLSYPIIQLPLEMTEEGGTGKFFRNRMLWVGFIAAAFIDIINGLNFLYPSVPSLGGRLYNIGPFFTNKPWSAIGWTPVALFPFAVGLGFFIPLDLSFSCWFFYIFWKLERILGDAIGLRNMPGFPFIDEQSFGAYIGLFLIAMWMTRSHLKGIALRLIKGKSAYDDSNEPMSYPWTVFWLLASFGFIVAFCLATGMSLWVIILFFAIYYAISTAVTRMRAELGSPVHDLHFLGPDEILPRTMGTRRFGAQNLTMFAYLFFFNRAYRSHPMPHQLEGFKLAERIKMNSRRLMFAMILAVAWGILTTFWSFLHISYRDGALTWFAWHPFNRLQAWLTTPRSPDYAATSAIGIGFSSTLFLMFMRMKFFWWPFHPAGYAISSSWSMNVFWFSIFASFLLKWMILRHGGLRSHRAATPFFFGLILGEFIVGSVWALVGISLHKPMYRFLY